MGPPEPVKCPCNIVSNHKQKKEKKMTDICIFQGKTVVSSMEKVLHLPMLVPSIFVNTGEYQASIFYSAVVKEKSEIFLTHVMKYQVNDDS